MPALSRVLVVYNTDYDEELTSVEGVDVSAVEEAAQSMTVGVRESGLQAEIFGVHGHDLHELWQRLMGDRPDLVFNACESMNGDVRNEVLLPAMLDMIGIPYTGPSSLAIALCLHKERTKQVLTACGVPTPEYRLIESAAELEQPLELAYPFFLKLAHEDASIGIEQSNVVADAEQLRTRAREMLDRYRQPVLAERFIQGREVNVTVMGPPKDLQVLPLHEISFADMPEDRPHIVSYAAKWDESHVDYEGTKPVPMLDVSREVEAAIRSVALSTFQVMGLRDFGRVDLRIDGDGQPWVIDVNPNCDLSPDAGVARTARAAGMDYPALLGRICEIAWSRYNVDAASSTQSTQSTPDS